jgi:phosphoribosylamine--glycine ligase
MKVLVIGGGAREHALCWKLSRSQRVSQVFCAPGNIGISQCAKCVAIAATHVHELLSFAQREGIDLTVVGPEVALEAGVVDLFTEAGLAIVGPTRAAAQLETSKAFAKSVMVEAGVPTARHTVCSSRSELERLCAERGAPLVLKADGLAAGKGVFVVHTAQQFEPAIEALFGGAVTGVTKAGAAEGAGSVVVEDLLTGVEVSCIFASNGRELVPLAPAHDYKRIFERDEGPNTGGMGSVCPTPRVQGAELEWIERYCAAPIVAQMAARGTPFRGFLYAGLMVPLEADKRPHGFAVVEYNTRLGDPECQAILTRLDSDLLELLEWMAGVRSERPELRWSNRVSTCVVVASDGYPEQPVKGDTIAGIELTALVPDVVLFHAATAQNERGQIVSTGGRTLSVVGLGDDYERARQTAYKAVDLIQLRGRRVRRDIGAAG